jgi:hypothetical protein
VGRDWRRGAWSHSCDAGTPSSNIAYFRAHSWPSLFQKYAEQADNKRSFELGKPQKKFSALGIGNTLPNLRKIFAAFGN